MQKDAERQKKTIFDKNKIYIFVLQQSTKNMSKKLKIYFDFIY